MRNKKFYLPFILAIVAIGGFIGVQSVIGASTYTQPLYAHKAGSVNGWCIEKDNGAVLAYGTLDPLFVVSGGPVRATITGIVSTVIGGTSAGELIYTTTTPSANFSMNATSVAITSDAAGTSYRNLGASSIFTPVTVGAVIIDPITAQEASFILPIGTVSFSTNAAQTGNIKWYMTYEPLSPNSLVTVSP